MFKIQMKPVTPQGEWTSIQHTGNLGASAWKGLNLAASCYPWGPCHSGLFLFSVFMYLIILCRGKWFSLQTALCMMLFSPRTPYDIFYLFKVSMLLSNNGNNDTSWLLAPKKFCLCFPNTSGILEPAHVSSLQPTVKFSNLWTVFKTTGNLKLPAMGVFTPWKSAYTVSQALIYCFVDSKW